MKTTGEQVSKLAQLQSAVVMIKDRTWLVKKYNMMSITEALEAAAQSLTVLAARLKRCSRGAEAEGINGLL